MTLQERLSAFISAVGTDIKALYMRSVPAGGTTGQVLMKTSNADYADTWGNVPIGKETQTTLTDGATIGWDVTSGRIRRVTLGGNRTLAISNAVDGDYGTLEVIQDGTGNRTLTFAVSCYVAGLGLSTTCPIRRTANARSVVFWWYNGSNFFVNVSTF